ncbi:MAG: hypothetical protein IT458_02880 [Planctomycetes bacterium]|nr:hypothetical protein [Planctomycetota bacterium]
MVKKASLFDKLMNRWRGASGVHVEQGVERVTGPSTAAPGNGGAHGASRVAVDQVPVEPRPESLPGRKLSPKEEALLAMGEGFSELSSLLRGVQVRMEGQGEHVAELGARLTQLPALAQAQLQALQALAAQMERQNESAELVRKTLGDVPALLTDVRAALHRAAVTDERAARTLDEFRGNMDRIQASISTMVQASREQAGSTAELVQEQRQGNRHIAEAIAREGERQGEAMHKVGEQVAVAQRESARQLEQATARGLEDLRRAQQDQATRLTRMAEQSHRSQRLVLTFLVVLGTAIVAALIALAVK